MKLTKTDFKNYLICPECFWFQKKKTEEYQKIRPEKTLFIQKLIDDGYEVENYAQQLFPSGVFLDDIKDEVLIEKTKVAMEKKGTIFQATFLSKRNLFLKADILKFNDNSNKWDLYEVKSSSEIKTDIKHNHIKDVCFQKKVLKECAVDLGEVFIIHLNKDYVRQGNLDLTKLFVVKNVDSEIDEVEAEVSYHIDKALELLEQDNLKIHSCSCLYKSAGQRCDCFSLFNPQVPEYSVAHILRGKRLIELVDRNIFDVKDIPEDLDLNEPLTETQRIKVDLQKFQRPLINRENIENSLADLKYPLYFLDYETLLKPVPMLDGYGPNSQIVFQYSLHILNNNGELEHKEYLADNLEQATDGLVKSLGENIKNDGGSILVWNQGFEKDRNKELGKLHPEFKDFFKNLNDRVYDLMLIFKKDYLLPEFKGSASIKKVLPVLIPELSYKELDVQDGTMAMFFWENLLKTKDEEERAHIKNALLRYCELDTLAMVKIYEFIKEI